MTSPTELLRFGLAALLTGMAIPLAVQLFLVLRNVQLAGVHAFRAGLASEPPSDIQPSNHHNKENAA